LIKKPLINNQIRARKVRLIDERGQNQGIFSLEEALKMAKEKNLDLIQVTEKADPPVCKLGNYGKFIYSLQKKERRGREGKKVGELRVVRIGFNISPHDLETKAKQAERFLKEGCPLRLEMILRGREKALADFGKEKIEKLIETLNQRIPLKIEREIKKEPRGFTVIIKKQ